jgi:hypothetical protein
MQAKTADEGRKEAKQFLYSLLRRNIVAVKLRWLLVVVALANISEESGFAAEERVGEFSGVEV